MLKPEAKRLSKLRKLQPELVCSKNGVCGCFHLSATRHPDSRNKMKVLTFQHNCTSHKSYPDFIYEEFYILATWTYKGKYLDLKVLETDGKLNSWKKIIPSKYWHVYNEGFFCLGRDEDLYEIQKLFRKFETYFINIISQFLYHMTYIQRHGVEPWEGDRHDLSRFFEDVSRLNLSNTKERRKVIRHLASCFLKEWEMLMAVMLPYAENKLEIKDNSPCPFCLLDEKNQKSGQCIVHEEDIERFNQVAKIVFKNRLYRAKSGYIKFENSLIKTKEFVRKRKFH